MKFKTTKKNKFYETKPDGTRTFAKQPLWMHSIDKPTHGDTTDALWSAAFILLTIAATVAVLYVTYG